jgi:phosphoribosylformylglycinamidine synthase PurS subunit
MSATRGTWAVRVNVLPRAGLSDPQGETIARALPALGFDGVTEVRVGKTIELELVARDGEQARARAIEMCERLLANPVIETYEVNLR